jgi:hypothetical protein
MKSSQSSDPIVDVAFYGGIILFASLLALRLATIIWQFLTSIWQVCALLFATIISTLYFVSAFRRLRYTPMRTDVDLQGIEEPELFDEPVKPEPKVQPAPALQEIQKREVRIDTDKLSSKAVHWYDFLIPEEQEYLTRQGYELKRFVPLGETHPQPFLIKKNGVESYEHTFVVNIIADELRQYTKKVSIHLTQYPDILFECKGKEWAVEVETPFGLPKKHRRLAQKAQENNQKYDSRWVIAVTHSAYAKSFKRYAKVLRRNEVEEWIKHLFVPHRAQDNTVPQNSHFGRAITDDNTQKKAAVPTMNKAHQD